MVISNTTLVAISSANLVGGKRRQITPAAVMEPRAKSHPIRPVVPENTKKFSEIPQNIRPTEAPPFVVKRSPLSDLG